MYIVNDIHYFANISDFIHEVKHATTIPGRMQESMKNDYDFTRTKSLDEAWEMIENGYMDEKGEQVLRLTEKLLMNSHKAVQFNDIKGFVPNVPNYLMGIPQTMINREVTMYRDKIINILVNTGVAWHVGSDWIFEKAFEIFRVIVDFETQGYRVNLYKVIGASNGSSSDGDFILGFIKLKDDRERINLKKMIFPLTHPSMQRRLDFRFRETFGKTDVTHNGYGTQRPWKKEYIRPHFKRLCNGDFLYANLDDYDANWYKSAHEQRKGEEQ